MKLSKTTIETLNNFSSINQGILIKEGSLLRTMSILRNIFAVSKIDDNFPKEFAIYDLNEFLSTLSLFNDPELQFKDTHILFVEGNRKVKYYYSSPSVIVAPPDKEISLPDLQAAFKLTQEDFNNIQKAAATLKLKHLKITNDGLVVFNMGATGNQVDIDVKIDVVDDATIDHIIKVENMKMISADYDVSVTARVINFTNSKNDGLKYYVMLEDNS